MSISTIAGFQSIVARPCKRCLGSLKLIIRCSLSPVIAGKPAKVLPSKHYIPSIITTSQPRNFRPEFPLQLKPCGYDLQV